MITLQQFRRDSYAAPAKTEPVAFMSRDVLVDFVTKNGIDEKLVDRPSQRKPYWTVLGIKIYEVARVDGFYMMTTRLA